MHVKVEVYQPPDDGRPKIEFPIEFLNMREYEVKRAVDDMVAYGISKIVTNYITLGLSSWADIKFRPLPESPSEALVRARNKILRLTAERIAIFGILEITLNPSEADMHAIKDYWTKLSGGKPGTKDKIPLNIELDPMPMQAADTTEVPASKPSEMEPPAVQEPDPAPAPSPAS